MTAFIIWSLANGYSPGYRCLRRNPDGDYSPENCAWKSRGAKEPIFSGANEEEERK
jgi:hypothetical protein